MAQTNVGEQCCSELGAQYWEGLLWRGNACSNLSHPFNFNTLFMLHSFCVLAPRYIPSWSLRVVWYHLTIIHDSLQTTIISFTLTYSQISAIIVVDELRTVLLFVSSKYHFSPGPFIQHGVGKVTFLAKFSYCLMRPVCVAFLRGNSGCWKHLFDHPVHISACLREVWGEHFPVLWPA